VLLLVALRVDVELLRDVAMELTLDRLGVAYRVDAYAVPLLLRFIGPVTLVRYDG